MFVIIDYEEQAEGVMLRTNMAEQIMMGADHPLELRAGVPYVPVRAGLYARISRSVYYNLVERFGSEIQSSGQRFSLGEIIGN